MLGLAWSTETARVLAISELCVGGSLGKKLKEGVTNGWPAELKRRVASGIATGLAFLHGQSPPVIHRDLKARERDRTHDPVCFRGAGESPAFRILLCSRTISCSTAS